MRSFSVLLAATLAASAAAVPAVPAAQASIQCGDVISQGFFFSRKNSLTGERVKLTLDSTSKFAGSTDKTQLAFEFVPCNSTAIGKPATTVSADGKTVEVYGRIQFGIDKCLQRYPADNSVGIGACATADTLQSQSDQFWNVQLVNKPDYQGELFADNTPVSFAQAGFYHHLANGKWYESTFKPPSTWFMTFTSSNTDGPVGDRI
ncbi:hypothetical protein BKA62DRAFT_730068 [Auriculariales sp. MPI-PUGE-AT-0066]|nr:hypothetical protein BKA62DRAFT_730068 [Auriculariales sp. MPI-PUGE-AT-0066]